MPTNQFKKVLFEWPLNPQMKLALAKIVGLKLCDYSSQYQKTHKLTLGCNATNLFGINDSYDLENSHVIPALIKKFHVAKISKNPIVEVWGSGNQKRVSLCG